MCQMNRKLIKRNDKTSDGGHLGLKKKNYIVRFDLYPDVGVLLHLYHERTEKKTKIKYTLFYVKEKSVSGRAGPGARG